MGREVYGRGADTLKTALRNGNGELLGLAQLMVWTTLAGYGAMSAKDILKGRTPRDPTDPATRSEEHTSELQSLMRISYAVFCLKKKKPNVTIDQVNTKHNHTRDTNSITLLT